MLRITTITVIAAIFVLAALPVRGADEWRYGLSADVVRDNNATRGLYDGKKADSMVAVEGSATRSWLLSPGSGLLVRGAARYSHFMNIEDISNLALIGRTALRFQPTRGFSAPWYEIAGQIQLLRHADSDLRDGHISTLEASAGSHITDRFQLSAGIGADKRGGGGGSVGLYDLSNRRIFAAADLRVGVHHALYARITRQTGDQVFSSGSRSGLSAVWEDDPALRGPLGLAVANVYRIDATTLSWELGFNYRLGPEQALDFSVARFNTEVEAGPATGNQYRSTQLRATYLYRFR